MTETKLSADVRRPNPFVSVIDIHGAITTFTEKVLTEAYQRAVEGNIRTVILNFSELNYMNSLGVGLLVTLLIRARREGKTFIAYGLNDHYRQIFQITRLDQAIPVYSNESTALAFAAPMDLQEREA